MLQARDWIRNSKSLVAFTGAGVSAESGIPTFRGKDGFWRTYRAEDLATPEAFDRNPLLVWEWYDWRRQLIAKAQPNPAHLALAALEQRLPSFTLITQNVDGLHQRAGSRNVITIHGDIWTLRCTACSLVWRDERAPLFELPPRCACGGIARPGVVWFGENVPKEPWREAELAALASDVFLVIGTSAAVLPASQIISHARYAGAKIIEINPEETWVSEKVDCSLRGAAGEILPGLAA